MRRTAEKALTRGPTSDNCGCAMGAKFLGAGLIGAGLWYGWHWRAYSLSLGGVAWRVMLIAFAAAIIGKIVGIARFKRSAARSLQSEVSLRP